MQDQPGSIKGGARLRRAFGVGFVACLLLTQGCVHLEQVVRLHRNGGCTVSYHYSIATEVLPLAKTGRGIIQQWQGQKSVGSGDGLSWFTNERTVREYFSGSGLGVRRYRSYERDGRTHVELVVFSNNALKMFGSGRFGGLFLSRDGDGNFVLSAAIPADPSRKALSAEEKARMRALCDDLRLRLEVVTPTDILATTAPEVDERHATWVFDAAQNGAMLTDCAEITLTFEGKTLPWGSNGNGAGTP